MSKETADNSVVSKPMGGLYAGPVPSGTANGPAITSTVTLHAPKDRPFRYDPEVEISPPVTDTILPKVSAHRVFGGEYDGHVTVSFKAGNGYNHSFSFNLPNVIGNLGVAGLNNVNITDMFERALIGKLGSGGVVRHETES